MKRLIITLSLVGIMLTNTFAGTNVINELFEDYKELDNSFSLNISSSLFKYLGDIEFDESDALIEALVDDMDGISMLIYDNEEANNNKNHYNIALKRLKSDGYSSLISIDEDDNRVKVLAESKKGNVDNIVILFEDEEGDFGILCFKGKIDVQTVKKEMEKELKDS